HAFLAKSAGAKILRRSYSYASGVNERGALDAGLLFISFQRDPAQFIAIQSALGLKDRMNEYITNIGSGVFACFGGVSRNKNDYIGKRLFS
ncbi:MAG: Dyp-type peroxidase, partial [Campylobacter sp.]